MKKEIKDIKNNELLKDRKVVEEINRHLWIESEKAGSDIGFENAAVDWLEKFSKAWMQYHMPKKKSSEEKAANTSKISKRKASPKKKRIHKT